MLIDQDVGSGGDYMPYAFNQGRDAQLEQALADIMKNLRSYLPMDRKTAPPFPTKLDH